jgi:transcriptional regulator with XRE-family HTH domain
MEKRGDAQIGRRLQEARAHAGLTQQQLSDASGIARSTIANIEAASRPVGLQNLMDLAEFFVVPVDYFTNRDDLMASAIWVLGRLPRDELEAQVKLLLARATRDKLPPRD